jgi:hypothetical protein
MTYLHRPTRIFPVNKPNLQERREGGDDDDKCEINFIPTIIIGITDQSNSTNKVSIYKRLSELRETINVNNKEVGSLLTKHKVVLIGDSNIRGYVYKLKHL